MSTSAPPAIQPVYVYIDANDLFCTARAKSFEIDYYRLLQTLIGSNKLRAATVYTGVRQDDSPAATKQRNFLGWLERNGFVVVSKPLQQNHAKEWTSDLSSEITTDMLLQPDGVSILVSGQLAFAYPVRQAVQRKRSIFVAAFRDSCRRELLEAATGFVPLEIEAIRRR